MRWVCAALLLLAVTAGCASGSVTLPGEDAPGSDLSEVPRYNPSVRVSYDSYTLGGVRYTDVEYYTADSFERVREFYLREMESRGWALARKEPAQGAVLPFSGASAGASLYVDFKRKECGANEGCLPYVAMTIAEFEANGRSYTYIGISYREVEEG